MDGDWEREWWVWPHVLKFVSVLLVLIFYGLAKIQSLDLIYIHLLKIQYILSLFFFFLQDRNYTLT